MFVAVLTLSDRCSQGLMRDTAGPAVVELVKSQWPEATLWTGILPDDQDRIAQQLRELVAQGPQLILTVGGTGFSPRDCAPEATRQVIDREAPGLAEAMRVRSAEKRPHAWLSRAIAGLAGRTLIVNLPGSERASGECLSMILPLLQHAVDIAAGGQSHP